MGNDNPATAPEKGAEPKKVSTEDGYVFRLAADGTWVDHDDPDLVDMVFESLSDLEAVFGPLGGDGLKAI